MWSNPEINRPSDAYKGSLPWAYFATSSIHFSKFWKDRLEVTSKTWLARSSGRQDPELLAYTNHDWPPHSQTWILRLEFSSLQYVGSALNQVPILSYHPEFESCTGQWYQQTPENIYSLDWKPAGSCRKPSAPCFFYTSTQGQPKGQDHSLRFLVELISHVHELKISAGIPNVDAEVLITRCKWSYTM